MVEPIVTGGVVLLIVAEIFKFVNRIRTSSCFGNTVTFADAAPSGTNTPTHVTINHNVEEKKN
jgi:hypothetical protein